MLHCVAVRCNVFRRYGSWWGMALLGGRPRLASTPTGVFFLSFRQVLKTPQKTLVSSIFFMCLPDKVGVGWAAAAGRVQW